MSRSFIKENKRDLAAMMSLLAVVGLIAGLYYLPSADKAKQAVEHHGYENVIFVSRDSTSFSNVKCGPDASVVFVFRAINPSTGAEVNVAVCSNPFVVGKVTPL